MKKSNKPIEEGQESLGGTEKMLFEKKKNVSDQRIKDLSFGIKIKMKKG